MAPKVSKEKIIPVEKLGRKLENEPSLEFTKKLYQEFPAAEIYVVGGTVRDCMMEQEDSKDYDLVVRHVSAKNLGTFLAKLGNVDLVGARFGVFKFVPQGLKLENAIDIALPRREIALGTGGYRDFETQSDPNLPIEEDLSRRDFTWNAMAYELRQGKLIDPSHGIFDLTSRLVRAVGQPQERFGEDYSRMLRAIRFAAKFGFEIETETWKAITRLAEHINDERKTAGKIERVVPYEIISREFLRALKADPLRTLELYEKTELLLQIFPEFEPMFECVQPPEWHSEGTVWTHTKMALANLKGQGVREFFGKSEASTEVFWAVLLHDIGKPSTKKTPEHDGVDRIRFDGHDKVGADIALKICQRLRVDAAGLGVSTDRVVWLVRNHLLTLNTDLGRIRKTTLEKYFFNPQNPGAELLLLTYADAGAAIPQKGEPDFSNLKKLMKTIADLEKLKQQEPKLPKPLLNGDQIMKILNLRPGQEVGRIISELREAQLREIVKTAKDAEKFIRELRL